MTASALPVAVFSFRSLRKGEPRSERLEATLGEQVPSWLDSVAERCISFVKLETNWDSYGGRPVHESVAQSTANLLLRLIGPSAPEPTVVPTSSGGIQLEWHTPNVDLEIELASAGRISAVFENRATGQAWEHDFESDLRLLVEAVGQLPEAR